MIRQLLLLTLGLLLVSSAGAEKLVDTQDALPGSNSLITIMGELTINSPTYNRVFGSDVSLDCLASMTLSASGTDVYYGTHCIQVTDSVPIELIVNPGGTTISDTVMTLYCDPFDPANPLANVVAYDDDGGDGLLSAFTAADGLTLTPGNLYWVVLATFSNGATGTYQIDSSPNVVNCSVAVETATWGTIKNMWE